ncbi:FMN-binding protein [Salinibacterium sp. SWN1162]|uniref:FMN-binding protein n=1 Tax=Salinibacterium sp. SWN1162 TaxID=2792053 RepID=UPI0018CED359|nr:FMN-binding protein [Salinibacterium sp. SWN1162]MBH0008559.1 FMN-binding protein [Salinibacterium sp. SWN1162]
MRNLTDNKIALALFAGVTLVGALSACSSPATSSTDSGSTDTTAPDAAATGTEYADGTYTESGDYTSPNGPEKVDVTLTLASDTITDVTVVGYGENPNSIQFQGEFIDGIAAEVVGKNIDELSVDKVAGSSLTSGGFNNAVDAIKADALAQ